MSNPSYNKALSILVTDDDQRMRESLRELLEVYGMQCTLAEDGQQALNLLEKQCFDLVLLDIQMPKLDGIQVMRAINEQYPETDVIILSGKTSFANAQIALRLKALDFLSKPYNPSELIHIINKAFKKRNFHCVKLSDENTAIKVEVNSKLDVEKTLMELENIIETEEQALTQDIINASPAVAFLWKNKPNWPVEFVSENVINLLGYGANEFMTGKVMYESIVHPDDLEQVTGEVVNDNKTKQFKHRPYRVISKYDIVKWIDDSTTIVRDEKGNISHYQGVLIDVTEREITRQKMLKEQMSLQYIAHHDPLTGLPNRLLLPDRLSQSIKKVKREEKHLVLLYIDLDNFKEINDTLGHIAGDEVLKSVAKRLLENIRSVDTVVRIEGDKFIVLLESVISPGDVKKFVEKLNQSLQQPLCWENQELFVTLSIGISLSPDDTEDPEELMEKAAIAMYHSKEQGKNTYQFYQEPKC